MKPKQYPMKRQCCVCGTLIGWGTCSEPDKISHGYCDECLKIELAKIEEYNNN